MLNKCYFTLALCAFLLGADFSRARAQLATEATPTPVIPSQPDITAATTESVPEASGSDEKENNPGSDLIALRLNLRAGQKFRVTQTSQVKTIFMAPATPSRASQKQETWSNDAMTMLMRVLYVQPDGSSRLLITFEKVSSRPLVILDQKNTAQSAQSRTITNAISRALRNKSVDLILSPLGEVSDVRGLGMIWKDLSNALSNSKLAASKIREAKLGIESLFNERSIVGIFDRAGMSFPDNPLRIGDAWNLRLSTAGTLPFTTNVQRTLKSRKSELLTVSESGTLRLNTTQVSPETSSASFAVNLSGTYTGTTQLDEATCFVRRAGFTQRFSGTISARNANGLMATTPLFGRVFTKTIAQEVK